MGLLVNNTSFFESANVCKFPANFDYDRKLKSCVEQAKDFNIKPSIGQALWNEILEYNGSPNDPYFDILILGGDYTYNDTLFHCNGINPTICFYAYKLYCIDGDIQETNFGQVIKKDPEYSEKISNDQRSQKINKNNDFAIESLKTCLDYLYLNSDKFPNLMKKNTNNIRTKCKVFGGNNRRGNIWTY